MYKIVLSKEASKYYQKVDKATRNRLNNALNQLINNPFNAQNYDIKPLHEPLKGLWRLRVGKLRIIYRVEKKKMKIQIATICSRGKAY